MANLTDSTPTALRKTGTEMDFRAICENCVSAPVLPNATKPVRTTPKLHALALLGIALTFLPATTLPAQNPPIKISVDASNATTRLVHATLQFPVKPGPLTLLYPEWIPGEHGPTGPITDLVGLKFSTAGKLLPWKRDEVNMFEFHLDIPAGASTLDVQIDFISPPESGAFSSGPSITSQLAVLSWNHLLLYPKGTPTDQLNYQATLKVPTGWRYGTALPIQSESGSTIVFKPSTLTTLIDSPVQTGANFNTIDLAPGGAIPHYMHVAADSKRATELSETQIAQYRNLVSEITGIFGATHYRDYHFLFTLSDHVAHFGLEHHESSDDRLEERALIDEDIRKSNFDLLPHEMVHSWNGKFRRPAGLSTGDYDKPMKGNLLWVYEGLTNYLGEVLGARGALATKQIYLDKLAITAANLDRKAGRDWRPLEDTAVAAQILYGARSDYGDFRRSVDYYPEGTLIWLDADVTIRQLSNGKKSLDDFCKAFYGGTGSNRTTAMPEVKPYTFDDVVATLNQVQPYDWNKFLTDRVVAVAPKAPLNGVLNGGYRIVYKPERNDYQKTSEGVRKAFDFAYSIGLTIKDSGDILDVKLGSPAYLAKMPSNGKLIAVNQRQFTEQLLRETLQDGPKNPTKPLELMIKDGEFYRNFTLDYHGGEQYPHLERDTAKADLISAIVAPKADKK